MTRIAINLLGVIALTLAFLEPAQARTNYTPEQRQSTSAALTPAYCSVNHDVGKVGLSISNDGTIGGSLSVTGSAIDCFTGKSLLTTEYPLGSYTRYLFGGALWIGAIAGRDTLVSTGADGWSTTGNEFHPDYAAYGGGMMYRSTIDPNSSAYDGAISEQDYIGVYRDTCRTCRGVSPDELDGRGHLPLDIEVTQRSFAWSYPHTEDFVLIDYSIKNIGSEPLTNMYIGLYMDQDIHDLNNQTSGAQDDFTGLWSGSYPVSRRTGCNVPLEIEMPWSADNDGDLNQVVYAPVPHVAGIRLLDLAGDAPQTTFNWFISNPDADYDFGPMRRSNARDFSTGGTGTPSGDRNKYYLLSNGDRDYDQVMVGTIGADDSIWLPPSPPEGVLYWLTGLDTKYVVSSGNLTLEPGQSAPLTLAFVCGENLHTSAANFSHLPADPEAYLAGLNFTDFLNNGVWAGWVYDNPGVDTDSDGYSGQFQLCGEDTLWYQGDGVPDWRALTTPTGPVVWVKPHDSGLYVRWNGFECENLMDWFSRDKRFEGYHAYLATADAPADFARIGSYDVEDYFRFYWDFGHNGWVGSPERMSLEETLCRYAPSGCDDPTWHPQDYTRQAPFVMPNHSDSLMYFVPVMANACRFGLETPFHKRFPNAPRPTFSRPVDVPSDSVDIYLTDDGYFKYYEYEFLIEGLIPDQSYWVAITSFEYGSVVTGAEPAESPVRSTAVRGWPTGMCCEGTVGNVDCDPNETISLGDLVALIDFLFINQKPLCCLQEADVNRSGGADPTVENITIGDVSMLIDYMFVTGPSLSLSTCQ
jgi:hypothetical protein